MPIRKPIPTVIRSFHFRENVYEIPVDAVLESWQDGGQLRIEASTGYLLTTLTNKTPRPQQTINYVRQPDGSWLAQDIVTLLASGSSLISGTLTFRDPIGETVVLTVAIETILFISSSSLIFDSTKPGDEARVLLNIKQQGATTPVSLSVDHPEWFTLAEHKAEAHFAADLTITPSFGGNFIYIRYTPNRTGRHRSRLVVTTPYDSQTVSLEGNATKKSNGYRFFRWPASQTESETLRSQSAVTRVHKLAIGSAVLFVGLVCLGYVYRCELIPDWCQTQDIQGIRVLPRKLPQDTVLVNVEASPRIDTNNKNLNNTPVGQTIVDEYTVEEIEKQKSEETPRMVEKVTARWQPRKQRNQEKVDHSRRSKPHWLADQDLKKNNEESDLEKQLNNKSTSKP